MAIAIAIGVVIVAFYALILLGAALFARRL